MIAESRRCVFRIPVGMTTLAISLLLACAGTAAGATWVVDDDGGVGVDFTTIQAAVDAASPGDTIKVASGTYYENVFVWKRLTLRGLDTGGGIPVVTAGGSGSSIKLSADGITVDGFRTINSGGDWRDAGIRVNSDGNTLINNIASNNDYVGIYLDSSSNNTLINNIASNNNYYGIWLMHSSSNNILTKNTCSNNEDGIRLYYSSNNNLTNNTCSNNDFFGIFLGSLSNYNNLTNNNCSNNYYGIGPYSSSNNNIYLNNFMNNGDDNVHYSSSSNIWNSTEPITYTYNGNTFTNYLGNYWDDYTDIDADNDGIWDHPCPIGSDNDFNPLVDPFGNYLTSVSPKKLLNVPFFSQRDPAWKDKLLDHSPYSVGEYGCALTSVAMVSKYFGFDTDPDRLNTSLTEVGGLDRYGLLHWEKVGIVACGRVRWMGWAGASWDRIDQELSDRNPVIANVSYPTTGYPHHFIVFIGKIDDTYYFLDPYDENEEIREWPLGRLGTYSLENLRIYHGTSSIRITAYSPVDIVVTDPDNLTISKESNEITGASYTEDDINGGDDLDDSIFIPYRKTGDYLITLIPETDASPDEKYTLIISTKTANTTLAENVSISEIPTKPYVFKSTCSDLNSDGEIDMTDVHLLLKHVGDHGDYEWAGDVNCDGVVDMGDVILLLNHLNDPGEYDLNCCEGE
ncbi:Periplasmic copper-binding protein (NosD) [Candidatus Methanoperedenaceae archaeon GB50]|nr:Periplasmic copper-binding protein (NosD) [Candidatus Methanoperedenaceae archaeon GB50]